MPKVMLIYGTRPEAIKMAPLVTALRADSRLETTVAVTGQHREMLDQVNTLFGIEPSYDLDIMRPGATLAELTARVMTTTSEMLAEAKPDVVVVQGDTSSAFVAALAAFYQGMQVVHLEAGLRTGNIRSPFPEEANRRLVGPLTSLHLAPTPRSRDNLLAEDVSPHEVVVTGNTVIDALQMSLQTAATFADLRLAALVESGAPILLVTSHRRESWGDKMAEAMRAIRDIAIAEPDLRVVLPMHRNQIVRDVIEPALGDLDNVLLTEPLDYHAFCHLMAASKVILTDSGGVQEEAPSLGKPVLVMRDTTERPEGLAAGTVKLVGTDYDLIYSEVRTLLNDAEAYARFANAANPYGDGRAAQRGAAAIAELLGVGTRMDEFEPPVPQADSVSVGA